MVQPLIFRPITLADRSAMETIRRNAGRLQSTYTFPVLYTWQKTLGLSICLWEDAFLIRIDSDEKHEYCFPCGTLQSSQAMMVKCLDADTNASFCFLSESDTALVKKWFPTASPTFTDVPEHADYLANVADLSRLQGGSLRHIRKEILYFRRGATLTQCPITEENLSQVFRITRAWDLAKQQGDAYADYYPILEAITHWSALGLSGSLFYKGQECVDYIIGSELSDDTYDIHFAKCSDLARGLDYESKHLFFADLDGRYTFVNMEEDMGLPGLRRRKLLLHPCAVVSSFRCDFSSKEI